MFKPVSREQNRLRMALDGPSGSGKTYTALRFAFALAGSQGKVAVIDTEHNTASKYEGDEPDGIPWCWDGCNLDHFGPATYQQVIEHAGRQKYDVLVIDSLSHAWMGAGGALEQVDRAKGAPGGNWGAWRDVTPQHNAMIDSIIRSPCHVIVTLRSRVEYLVSKDENGKTKVEKVGVKPVQREGVEYEFDIVGDLDLQHTITISKTRCSLLDGRVVNKPDAGFMEPIKEWLFSGRPRSESSNQSMGPLPKASVKIDTTEPKADGQQTDRIKEICRNLKWSPDKLRSTLNGNGVNKLADLTISQAEGLIRKLEQKDLENQAKETF